MRPGKRLYLRKLGYTEQRIKELEQQEAGSKEKGSALLELVYKELEAGSPAKPNAIMDLVRQKLSKDRPAASPTASPLINRLIAAHPPGWSGVY